MADGVTMEGFDELFDMFEDMEISEQKERKALKAGGEVLFKSVQDNAPTDRGKLKKSIKKSIKRYDGDLSCEIKVNSFYGSFTEFGTSQDKSHIGWFEKAIKDAEDEAIERVKEVIFNG